MGKGDPKTKRGKISIGSYGNTRKRKKPVVTPATKKASAKKATPKKDVIKKEAAEKVEAKSAEGTEDKVES